MDTFVRDGASYPSTQLLNETANFTTVHELVYPFLEFAFQSASFAATINDCAYNIPVPAELSLKTIQERESAWASAMGIDLRANYDEQMQGVNQMVSSYITQSEACKDNATATTAIWNMIQNPNAFMTKVTESAVGNSSLSFILPLILGVSCLLMTFFFRMVSMNFLAYEKEQNDFGELLLDITAGSRAQLLAGRDVIINHVVDKPKLNGQRAKIVSDGTDPQGKVAVKLTDVPGTQVVYLQEWNLSKDSGKDEEDILTETEKTELRLAEEKYKHESRGLFLGKLEKVYTILCQIITGFSMHGLITFPVMAQYAGIAAFAVLAQGSALDTGARQAYSKATCGLWLQCFAEQPAPFCGACSVNLPTGATYDLFAFSSVPNTWAGYFTGSTVSIVLVWVISFASCGFLLLVGVVKMVGKSHWTMAVLCGLVGSIPFAMIGFGFWVFDASFQTESAGVAKYCSNPDQFWADPVNGQGMETECITQSGIELMNRETFSLSNNSLYLGFMINQFVFLLDSTFTLSTVLSSMRGANDFCKFEIKIFLHYFLAAIIALVLFRASDLATRFTIDLTVANYRFVFFAEQARDVFGVKRLWSEHLYADTTLSPLDAANALANANEAWGYGSTLSTVVLIVATCVQVLGVWLMRSVKDVELSDDLTSMTAVRGLIAFNVFTFATYILLVIMLSIESPFIHQLIAVLFFLPLGFQVTTRSILVFTALSSIPFTPCCIRLSFLLQIIFVVTYALQSDVLKAKSKLYRNVASLMAIVQLIPIVSIVLATIGLGMYVDRERIPVQAKDVGLPLLISGLSGLMLTILALGYLFHRQAYHSLSEWCSSGFLKMEHNVQQAKAKAEEEMIRQGAKAQANIPGHKAWQMKRHGASMASDPVVTPSCDSSRSTPGLIPNGEA